MASSGRAFIVGNTDGIGLALTRRLLGDGWSVVGLSRRASPVEDAPAIGMRSPTSRRRDYRPALQSLLTREGPFDVCVYCAGIGELLDVNNLAGDAGVFRVNLIGAVETAAAVLPPMIAAGRGHFIGLSSIGDGVWSDAPSYAASKAGLSSYLEGMALALQSRGVRVTNLGSASSTRRWRSRSVDRS